MRVPQLEERLNLRERPKRSNIMYQRWENLLFLHWQYDPQKIQKTLPKGLYVDTFEGKAFLGVVPFYMRNIRPRLLPAIPGISNFLEMNLRTYVHDGNGNAGVWFYSLDANQWLAVKLARGLFHLPYFRAQITAKKVKQQIHYQWQRDKNNSSFVYEIQQPLTFAEPGTLDFFLVERYILFCLRNNYLYTGHVHHTPYPICQPKVSEWNSEFLDINGFSCHEPPCHQLMSPRVDVEVFYLQRSKHGVQS
ncbi:YqjF family protein [Candidatus Uabimicrobium sp. HlEnr_7]|uniref:YqjF family protein n=1 Tax=Candidatus Uabimicrobium helgolandensis TaxID=3095367 RepID=UPI003558F920